MSEDENSEPYKDDSEIITEMHQMLTNMAGEQTKIRGHLQHNVMSHGNYLLLKKDLKNLRKSIGTSKPTGKKKSGKKKKTNQWLLASLFVGVLLIAVSVASHSLYISFRINNDLEKRIQEKIDKAVDIDQSLEFFEKAGEGQDAGQSD